MTGGAIVGEGEALGEVIGVGGIIGYRGLFRRYIRLRGIGKVSVPGPQQRRLAQAEKRGQGHLLFPCQVAQGQLHEHIGQVEGAAHGGQGCRDGAAFHRDDKRPDRAGGQEGRTAAAQKFLHPRCLPL